MSEELDPLAEVSPLPVEAPAVEAPAVEAPAVEAPLPLGASINDVASRRERQARAAKAA